MCNPETDYSADCREFSVTRIKRERRRKYPCADYRKTGVLCIEVTDDGCGAPDDLMEAINHRRQEQLVGHIGVSNVDTILRLTYGEEYGIYMEKLDGNIQTTKDGKESGGTRVTLRLPVRREKA